MKVVFFVGCWVYEIVGVLDRVCEVVVVGGVEWVGGSYEFIGE